MPFGLPTHPPEDLTFVESLDDETCPNCGWDREEAALDPVLAHGRGTLLAIEQSEGSPFSTMGTTLSGFYWRCPKCGVHFSTEEENSSVGGMS